MRRGRGGALHVDRRTSRRSLPRGESLGYPRRLASSSTAESEMAENGSSEKEDSWRIRDRWLFDADDEPSVGPDGPDEKDRVLVDEFHPKYVPLNYQNCSSLTTCLDICSRGCPCTRRTITNG